MKKIKRFIAGAICPACGEQDKLYLVDGEDGQRVRACVRCDFSERQRFELSSAELDTRVNRSREQVEQSVQLVKLLTPDD